MSVTRDNLTESRGFSFNLVGWGKEQNAKEDEVAVDVSLWGVGNNFKNLYLSIETPVWWN